MAQKQTNTYQVQNHIAKVLHSCEDHEHLINAYEWLQDLRRRGIINDVIFELWVGNFEDSLIFYMKGFRNGHKDAVERA